MRIARTAITVIFCALLLPAAGLNRTDLRASEEEPQKKKITADVLFMSIEAGIKDYGDEKENGKVHFESKFDDTLEKELTGLAKKKGYNYFRTVNDGSLTVSNKGYSEYRLVSARDYPDMKFFVKTILDRITVWKDHKKREHKYVKMSGLIVKRVKVKVKDDGGEEKEKTVDKRISDFNFERETGAYFTLIWRKFFKRKVEDKTVTSDLILVISPQK